eukprot:1341794-Prorocentrum_lima.AAC.1
MHPEHVDTLGSLLLRKKSDAPKEMLRVIDLISNVGPLRVTFGVQIVRLPYDTGGEFINDQPRSSGLIERMLGL